jgi:hypothetical protein
LLRNLWFTERRAPVKSFSTLTAKIIKMCLAQITPFLAVVLIFHKTKLGYKHVYTWCSSCCGQGKALGSWMGRRGTRPHFDTCQTLRWEHNWVFCDLVLDC